MPGSSLLGKKRTLMKICPSEWQYIISMETFSNYRPLILVWIVSYELGKRTVVFMKKSI